MRKAMRKGYRISGNSGIMKLLYSCYRNQPTHTGRGRERKPYIYIHPPTTVGEDPELGMGEGRIICFSDPDPSVRVRIFLARICWFIVAGQADLQHLDRVNN